ncbi:hypothetical protein [Thalassospira mesophila]|uniref:Uncharacterized protein n=1 Tax=Thalassospira mesophila TaxID=1293891 RepID=A0A1Y2L2M4_9PROT|nr:hypothetical protein [Thalassospira mesophila]OSQ39729.1 hypothetical protein TMES_07140 [Thalassospira mesophila]
MAQGQMALLKRLLQGSVSSVATIVLAVTPLLAHTARDGFCPITTQTAGTTGNADTDICAHHISAGAGTYAGSMQRSGGGISFDTASGPSPNGDDAVGAPDNGSLPKSGTVANGYAGPRYSEGANALSDLPPGMGDPSGMAGELPHVIWHVFGAPAGSDIGLEQERKFIRDGWPTSPQKIGHKNDLVANEPATKLCNDGKCPAIVAPQGAKGVTGSTTGTSGT